MKRDGLELHKENLQFLDSIDFEPFLTEDNVEELMHNIETYYRINKIPLPDCCEGFVFNWLNTYEVARYLKNRYPNLIAACDEECTTTYYFRYRRTQDEI